MTTRPGIRRILPLAALALAAVTAPLRASQEVEAQPKIVTHMKAVNAGLRALRRSFSDPAQKKENLGRIADTRSNAEAAREEQPLKTTGIPELEREAFLKGFRESMDELLSELDHLKAAIESGDADAARDIIRKIYDLRTKAHDIYQKEVDGEPEK